MPTLKLNRTQKKIETQKGSVYVKFSEHYTATVRNLKDFIRVLNDKSESKDSLEIISNWNVSLDFLSEVQKLIAKFRAIRIKRISRILKQEYKDLQELEEVNRRGFSIEDFSTIRGTLLPSEKRTIILLKRMNKHSDSLSLEIPQLTTEEFDQHFACNMCCEFEDWTN